MGVYTIVEFKDQLSKVIDEVEAGEIATITRHGKSVATIMPVRPVNMPEQPVKKAVTKEYYEELARRREARGNPGIDWVKAVREMRDEFT